MRINSLVAVLVMGVTVSGCADNPYARTATGAAVGALAGGVIGHQLNHGHGRFVGAAAGAALGAGIGYAMDKQAQQLQQLAAENQRLGLEVQRQQDGSIRLGIPSEVSFDFDSAAIRPEFAPVLDQVSGILNQDNSTSITIIGHTDSVGSDTYNMDLSQRRANSVADFLAARGISRNRLIAEGRGEREPRASNSTEAGRRQNRRVEMIIRPPAQG